MKNSNNPGVYEDGWAGQDGASTNDYIGCENNCLYCYAKLQAIRRKLVADEHAWGKPKPNKYRLKRKITKLENGRYMYPTTHDLTEANISLCMDTILAILEAGNDILIVSKPRIRVMEYIINAIPKEHSTNVEFRFSIGSMSDYILKRFEPNAPLYDERKKALELVFNHGYKTSVSIEPYLDDYPEFVVMDLDPFVTEMIWIGTMNYVNQAKALHPEIRELGHLYVPDRVRAIKEKLDNSPTHKIRYKKPFLVKTKEQ